MYILSPQSRNLPSSGKYCIKGAGLRNFLLSLNFADASVYTINCQSHEDPVVFEAGDANPVSDWQDPDTDPAESYWSKLRKWIKILIRIRPKWLGQTVYLSATLGFTIDMIWIRSISDWIRNNCWVLKGLNYAIKAFIHNFLLLLAEEFGSASSIANNLIRIRDLE